MNKGVEILRALEKYYNNPKTKEEFDEQFKPYNPQKPYTLSDHIRCMILAMLSANRPWGPIEAHLKELDEIFFHYDAKKLKAADPEELASKVKAIRCGNRNILKQMQALKHNIEFLEKIQKEHGSIDEYYRSMTKYKLVTLLNVNFKQLGATLISEYLPGVGIDLPKPDVHIRRFLGKERLGFSKYSPARCEDCYSIISEIAKESGEHERYIDYLFWAYCAVDREHICSSEPDCSRCIIKQFCNYGK